MSAWFPLTGAPFAIAHCGSDDAPAPVVSCPAAPMPPLDAGTPEAATDAGTSAPPDSGVPAPTDAAGTAPAADAGMAAPVTPDAPKPGGSSGCSSGGDAPASLAALFVLPTAAGFARTLLRRRRSRQA
jgi:hypothetical protein